jgi:aryl-alcohol dehydrogenase-like predicted oxidoreductase
VVPIPGTSSIARLEENVAAVGVRLTAEDLARIEQAAPIGAAAGERYSPEMLELTDR